MKVSDDVLTVLSQVETDGPHLRITEPLDRKLYTAVNKVLVAAGGKWTSGKVKAHVFPLDAADAIDQVMLTGEITTAQEVGWFPTPSEVVEQMLDLADIKESQRVLEPSAGEGAIVAPLIKLGCRVTCIEIDSVRVAKLHSLIAPIWPHGFIHEKDFLTVPAIASYDRVVMNPPFARQADI